MRINSCLCKYKIILSQYHYSENIEDASSIENGLCNGLGIANNKHTTNEDLKSAIYVYT